MASKKQKKPLPPLTPEQAKAFSELVDQLREILKLPTPAQKQSGQDS